MYSKDLEVFVTIVTLSFVLLRVTYLDDVDSLTDQIYDFAYSRHIILAPC